MRGALKLASIYALMILVISYNPYQAVQQPAIDTNYGQGAVNNYLGQAQQFAGQATNMAGTQQAGQTGTGAMSFSAELSNLLNNPVDSSNANNALNIANNIIGNSAGVAGAAIPQGLPTGNNIPYVNNAVGAATNMARSAINTVPGAIIGATQGDLSGLNNAVNTLNNGVAQIASNIPTCPPVGNNTVTPNNTLPDTSTNTTTNGTNTTVPNVTSPPANNGEILPGIPGSPVSVNRDDPDTEKFYYNQFNLTHEILIKHRVFHCLKQATGTNNYVIPQFQINVGPGSMEVQSMCRGVCGRLRLDSTEMSQNIPEFLFRCNCGGTHSNWLFRGLKGVESCPETDLYKCSIFMKEKTIIDRALGKLSSGVLKQILSRVNNNNGGSNSGNAREDLLNKVNAFQGDRVNQVRGNFNSGNTKTYAYSNNINPNSGQYCGGNGVAQPLIRGNLNRNAYGAYNNNAGLGPNLNNNYSNMFNNNSNGGQRGGPIDNATRLLNLHQQNQAAKLAAEQNSSGKLDKINENSNVSLMNEISKDSDDETRCDLSKSIF